jgi:peptidoglycan hydrolase-like protein with peptidoglycan-binding domain
VNVQLDVLKKGSKGKQVKALQRMLYAMGYNLGDKKPIDGEFGSKTDSAVRSYQDKNGLKVDGIVGQNTWTKLLGA